MFLISFEKTLALVDKRYDQSKRKWFNSSLLKRKIINQAKTIKSPSVRLIEWLKYLAKILMDFFQM
jgi:hypothetical protein